MSDLPEEPDQTAHPAGRTRRVPLLLLSALGAATIALSVVLASVVGDRDDLREELGDQQEVAEVAGRFAEAVAAFDHEDLDASRSAVEELATDGFQSEYDTALSGELRQRLLASEVVIDPTVQEVHVGSLGAAQASAVVELDLTYRTVDGTFDVAGSFLLLTMVRTPDGWRVEGVENLRAGVDSRFSGLLEPDGAGDAPAEGDSPGGADPGSVPPG